MREGDTDEKRKLTIKLNIMNKNTIKENWTSNIEDIIKEVYEYDFDSSNDTDLDQLYEVVGERLWETIDGCEDVIYTHNAQEISNIIDIYGAFDEWELTGDRFENWSQCAFSNIFDFIQNEIDVNEMCEAFLNEKNDSIFDNVSFKPHSADEKGVIGKIKFDNGFGASIARHEFSYGGKNGLYEVAVLDENDEITYKTSITDDVKGNLSTKEVEEILNDIKKLD